MKKSKVISLVLCLIIAFNTCACNYTSDNSKGSDNPLGQIQTSSSENEGIGPGADDVIEAFATKMSYDYKDYIGDLETFVYGLLITKLEYIYDVFPAYVQLSSGHLVYGLGYTDYTECYTNEDESVVYFMSGFISFVGEYEVPQEDFDTGLYVFNIEDQDENTLFVWKYKSEAFSEHCVVYGMYLQYGVDVNGQVTYNAIRFGREKCDTSLGSLYSYDDFRYLYDVDFGEYMPISGISLAEIFDYVEFEREVNAFIEAQNANWISYDIETVAYTSQDAVVGFLLSLQEETFLGYPVEQLVELSQELNPLECFRITPEGLTVIDIQEIPQEGPSALCKWLVGTSCAIVAAVGLVGSFVALAIPSPWKEIVSTVAGALTGASIEIFMQVVVNNTELGDVQWSKVCIATVSGAVSGFLNPYLMGMGGAKGFIVDTVVDALISGVEQMTYALVDGEEGKELLSSFGTGFIIGAAISAGFKGIAAGGGAIIKKISKPTQQVADNLAPKLTRTASNIVENTTDDIDNSAGKVFKTLKKSADPSAIKSEKIAKKEMNKALKRMTKEDAEELFNLSFGQGTMSWKRVVDNAGKSFDSIEQFEKYCMKAENGSIIGFIEEGGQKIPVQKLNNAYSIAPQELYPTVKPKVKHYDTFSSKEIREANLFEARKEFVNYFAKNPDEIPDVLEQAIKKQFPDDEVVDVLKSNMETPSNLKKIFEIGGALHENLDGTVTYMPKEIHGKIGHMGSVKLEKYIKQKIGLIYFDSFVVAAKNGAIVGV